MAIALIALAIACLAVINTMTESHVEQIADSRIIAHQDDLSKLIGMKLKVDTAGFAERLGGVVSTLESVAAAESATHGQGESGGRRRLPAGADFEYQPCHECGQVFIIDVMQRIDVYHEEREQCDPDYMYGRRPAPAFFYCPEHKQPYQVAARQRYTIRYGRTINEARDMDRRNFPQWRYYNIVPAAPERWDEVPATVEPAKVRVKRGRKSAADRLREATAAGEDVTAEAKAE